MFIVFSLQILSVSRTLLEVESGVGSGIGSGYGAIQPRVGGAVNWHGRCGAYLRCTFTKVVF